jgi:hypothetical protein
MYTRLSLALFGVVGALIGLPVMDSVGAILVAILIARTLLK